MLARGTPLRSGAAMAEDPFVKHAPQFELIEFTGSMAARGAETLKSL